MKNDSEKRAPHIAGINMSLGQLAAGTVALVAAVILLGIALAPAGSLEQPPVSQAGSQSGDVTDADCQIIQHLHYTPCGHEMTRRQNLPAELAGQGREAVEAAYDQWRITEFSSKQITMEQQLDMYCSQHVVIMPDETGVLGIFENKYGDALAYIRSLETRLDALPEAIQEEIRRGKGFDTLAELEQWMENAES